MTKKWYRANKILIHETQRIFSRPFEKNKNGQHLKAFIWISCALTFKMEKKAANTSVPSELFMCTKCYSKYSGKFRKFTSSVLAAAKNNLKIARSTSV